MSEREMTPYEAIIVLDRLNAEDRIEIDRDELRAAVKVAKEALRYRSPQKVTDKDYYDENGNFIAGWCPECEKYNVRLSSFCVCCGQRLDWSET